MVCPSSDCKQGLPLNLPPTIGDQAAPLGRCIDVASRGHSRNTRHPLAHPASVPPDPSHGMSPRFRLARLAFCRP
jgi:hypothetical protein